MNTDNNWEASVSRFKEGDRIRCRVTSLLEYGCKVEVEDGIEGFIHLSDMAWVNCNIRPSDIVSVNDAIEAQVSEINLSRESFSLSLKHCRMEPWDTFISRYKEGDRTMARVISIRDYGCTLELDEGVEGIVHVSEMDWVNPNIHPSKIVSLGDRIEAAILDINEYKQRISLGIKQCRVNPWVAFAQKYQPKDTVSGTVQSITDFVIFMTLEDGLSGNLFPSDILKEEVLNDLRVGDTYEMVLLSINAERERICLGIQ